MLALSASALFGMHTQAQQCIDVRFKNDSNRTIRYLYVSPSTLDGWFNDVLGSYILNPGDAETFEACFRSDDDDYDFKAVFDDGSSTQWRDGVPIHGYASVWVDSAMVLHYSR